MLIKKYTEKCQVVFNIKNVTLFSMKISDCEEENLRKLTSNSPLLGLSHTNANCYFEDCPLPSTPARSLI